MRRARRVRHHRVRTLAVLLATGVLVASCGGRVDLGGDGVATDPPGAVETPAAPSPPVAPPPVEDEPAADDLPETPDPVPDDPPNAPPTRDAAFTAPVRAAWAHLFDATLTDPGRRAAALAELRTAGIDVLFAQPIRRHDAYHRSRVLPRTPDPAVADGRDVLADLLADAGEAGVDVHAWFSVAPTDHPAYAELPAPAGWLATTHGLRAPEADRWVTRDVDGTWSDYLDIALPEVRDHVVAVVTELAATYPVAGVHLDYVRYPSARHGYHPRVLARYREETGTSGTPRPDDPSWTAWRQRQGTALVAAVRAALDDLDRPVALSAAVVAWGDGPAGRDGFAATRPAREGLQDWESWVERDLVDAVLPMVYFREHDATQAGWFAAWLRYLDGLADRTEVAVVPGVGAYLNATDAVVDQTRRATAATDGAAIYSVPLPTVDDDRSVWARLAREAWPAG